MNVQSQMQSICAVRHHVCLLLFLNWLVSSHASPSFVSNMPIAAIKPIPSTLLPLSHQNGVDIVHVDRRDLFDSSIIVWTVQQEILSLRGGGIIPAGWNPFGYAMTSLGEEFLKFDGSLDCDIGRFIASLKASRKTKATIKETWLEIVRVSKTGQAMRVYRKIDEIIDFCLKAGLID
jgi:hypothetical protein